MKALTEPQISIKKRYRASSNMDLVRVELALQQEGEFQVQKNAMLRIKGHPSNDLGEPNLEISVEGSQRQILIESTMQVECLGVEEGEVIAEKDLRVLLRFLSFLFVFMMQSVNILVWNCRGVAKRGFGSFIKDLRHKHEFSILVLLKTRVSGGKANKIDKKFGFDGMFRVDPDGFVGGAWVFWDLNACRVKVLSYSCQVVHMKVENVTGSSWFFFACYGLPQRVIREQLWLSLKSFFSTVDRAWLVVGDFNSVVSEDEVYRPASLNHRCSAFINCIETCDLQDGGFQGPPYMWKRNSLKERLDRVLVNRNWLESFLDFGGGSLAYV